MTESDNSDTATEGLIEALSPERRNAILDGAGRVFARDGYEGASMARIAREVGVSKGTLYNYFPGKAALFHAVVSTGCDRTIKHIFDNTPDGHDPQETLHSLGLSVMDLMLSPYRQAIHRMVMSEAGQFPELARSFFEAGPQRALNYLATWLEAETKAGRLAVADPDFAAEQFFALCQTKIVMRARLRLIEPTPADIERVVQGAISLFLKAYAAPQSAAPQPAAPPPAAPQPPAPQLEGQMP